MFRLIDKWVRRSLNCTQWTRDAVMSLWRQNDVAAFSRALFFIQLMNLFDGK